MRKSPTRKHDDLVNYYFANPEEIEGKFKPICKEFGAGNWRRIDILGIDRNKTLCIVEVKTIKVGKAQELSVRKQTLKYRSGLLRLFDALNLKVPVRILVVCPDRTIDLGITSGFVHKMEIKMPSDLPTSHKIYGLKSDK